MKTTYLNQHSTQEKMILGLTAAFVIAFICFFFIFQGNKHKVSHSEIQNINYEMAKVKSSESLYSLDGREIDRDNQELALEVKAAAQSTSEKTVKNAKNKKEIVAKNIKNKNQTAMAAQNLNKKSKKLKPEIAQSRPSVQGAELKIENKDLNTQVNAQSGPPPMNTEAAPVVDSENKPNADKNIKTIEEWTKEIQASEDRQIILKFVAAYKKKEVTESEFYSVVTLLLVSNQETKKGFGLYALRATPSYPSYIKLVQAQASLNSSYKVYVQETLLTYNQSDSLKYLRQALSSTEKLVVLKTLEIIKVGLNDVKNGATSALVESRYRRDSDFMNFAVQNYQAFLPQLTTLQNQSQQSGDQDIFSAAQQLQQTIQLSSNVAVNP